MPGFKRWPSTPPLFGHATLTEKIDGHTVGIHVELIKRNPQTRAVLIREGDVMEMNREGQAAFYRVWVQSRNRYLTPQRDVAGVAAWAQANAAGLAMTLGPGRHFGEWWGYKICRTYGLPKGDRRFSLFNTQRWSGIDGSQVPGLYAVPVLWAGVLSPDLGAVTENIEKLRAGGSVAVPGYMYPEGTVLWHHEADTMLEHTFERRPRRGQAL